MVLTWRLDQEKLRLSELEQATQQNAALREQVAIMSRQIELQQELAQRQVKGD